MIALIALALCIANYVTVTIIKDQFINDDGIPGNSQEKLEIKRRMDKIKLLVLQINKQRGHGPRSKRQISASAGTPSNLSPSNSSASSVEIASVSFARSPDTSALDAIEQLLAKFWPYINGVTDRTGNLTRKLNGLNKKLSQIRQRMQLKSSSMFRFTESVQELTHEQQLLMLSKSFLIPRKDIKLEKPHGKTSVKTVRCSNSETKKVQNWFVDGRNGKRIPNLRELCKQNDGEIGPVAKEPASTYLPSLFSTPHGNRVGLGSENRKSVCYVWTTLTKWGFDVNAS